MWYRHVGVHSPLAKGVLQALYNAVDYLVTYAPSTDLVIFTGYKVGGFVIQGGIFEFTTPGGLVCYHYDVWLIDGKTCPVLASLPYPGVIVVKNLPVATGATYDWKVIANILRRGEFEVSEREFAIPTDPRSILLLLVFRPELIYDPLVCRALLLNLLAC